MFSSTTRKMSMALAAILATAGMSNVSVAGASGFAGASAPTHNANQPTQASGSMSTMDKISRLVYGQPRVYRAPTGKRYRASIKQHQRNAAKIRNVKKHRKSNRG